MLRFYLIVPDKYIKNLYVVMSMQNLLYNIDNCLFCKLYVICLCSYTDVYLFVYYQVDYKTANSDLNH